MGFFQIGQFPIRAGDQWNPQGKHGGFGGNLIAHHADVFRRWTNKDQTVGFHRFGKIRIFGQEPVSGVDGFRPGYGRGRQNGRHIQVRIARGGRANAHGLIRQTHMHGIGISGGMNRHGFDPEFPAGAQDTQGDLATVGDKDFGEHYSMMASG